jgi:DNA polymerase/3'-5' exonuclease PolX
MSSREEVLNVKGFVECLDDLIATSSGYRQKAFQQAKQSLLSLKKSQLTLSEVKLLPGIGEGLLKRIHEFVSTKHLSELKDEKERARVTRLFEGIYGVGPVLSRKWYEQGYRKLEDLPLESLTKAQRLGVRYYEQINSRIPRIEVAAIEKELVRELSPHYQVQVCGSYLRGKMDSGDVDVVLSPISQEATLETEVMVRVLLATSVVKHILAKGKKKILCLGGADKMRRIDFELVPPEELPFAILYFTGSKQFNQHMRGVAKDQGYLLNEKGLFKEGRSVQVRKEKEIFTLLGVEYVLPKDREEY